MSSFVSAGAFAALLTDGSPILFDVRSPSEYSHARIPGAVNLPVLDDEARHQVGLTYKAAGREAAMIKGFELTGHLFGRHIQEALAVCPDKHALLYCWRGGLRSSIMAWLLESTGFRVTLLLGGYKAFRRWALDRFTEERMLMVLGGKTGCGKTEMLHALREAGEQVIDLEEMASHKGSAFGGLGLPPQPGNEQFENELALAWATTDPGRRVWIENESRLIGRCLLPEGVYRQLREAPVIEIVMPREVRLRRILKEYGGFPAETLREKTNLVRKRLGGLQHRKAVEALDAGRLSEWAGILLSYYDRTYAFSGDRRDPALVRAVAFDDDDTPSNLAHLMSLTGAVIP